MAFELGSPFPKQPTPRLFPALSVLLICGALSFSARQAWCQKQKFYFSFQGVKASQTIAPAVKQKAEALFLSELKKYPEVITHLGVPAPQGPELLKVLKARGLKGFGLVLRITKDHHQILPPAPGKVFKVLMVEVAVAIDAEKLPSSQMALAGEGSAQVGTEISKFKEKERVQLMLEALTEATTQAVKTTIEKLGEKKTTPATKATKKYRSSGKNKRKK